MAVLNPEAPRTSTTPPPEPNDEIDLREYLLVLVNWWREILLVTVLAVVATGAFLFVQRMNSRPLYAATVTVVVARVISDVNLASGLRMQVDASGANVQGGAPRRATLVALVNNGQIAEAVIEELGHLPGMEEVTPAQLLRWVEATSVTDANQTGDLIDIRVTSSDPELSAAIANAWARHYVSHINSIYGQMPDDVFAAVDEQRLRAEADYMAAQAALEAYIATNPVDSLERAIGEREATIEYLQHTQTLALNQVISSIVGANTATIAAYFGALGDVRLAALRSEYEANAKLFADLVAYEIENRRLALSTEQEMRRALFKQFSQAELENRIAALEAEQTAKARIFAGLSEADVMARLSLYNEQFNHRIATVIEYYQEMRRLQSLLDAARGLEAQSAQANGANIHSSALALTLLKTQIFATPGQSVVPRSYVPMPVERGEGLQQATQPILPYAVSESAMPTSVQLNIGDLDLSAVTADELAQDLAALVTTLESRIGELDTAIAAHSNALLTGDDYLALAGARADTDPLFSLVQETYLDLFDLGPLAQAAGQYDAGTLTTTLAQKYDELFQTGPLVHAALTGSVVPAEPTGEVPGAAPLSTLQATIRAQYPQLFDAETLASMIASLDADNELSSALFAQLQESMNIRQLEEIPGYTAIVAPTQGLIRQLESEVRQLAAQVEHEQAQYQQLTRARDRAAVAYDTLSSKVVELELQRAASNREVSIGAFAIVPDAPIAQRGILIQVVAAGAAAFALAIFMVLVAHLLGTEPPTRRRRAYA